MDIGKAIKVLLLKRDMTQKQLSKKTGMSETSISLILKGHTQPRKETLESIAKALKVKPEFLLFLSIDQADVPKEKRELYDMVWPQMEDTFLKLFVK